jgi:hypothetical protein
VGVLFKGNGSPVPGGQDAVLSERFREFVAKERSALPPPEQILARYVDALGGAQALRRITARKSRRRRKCQPTCAGSDPRSTR